MEKTYVTQNQIVSQLMQIGHGDLDKYVDVGIKAVINEPELFAHIISYNHEKGEIRDSKAALPVIAMRGEYDPELIENAVAHLCLLSPLEFMKAIKFHKKLGGLIPLIPLKEAKKKKVKGYKHSPSGIPVKEGTGKMLKEAAHMYVRVRENHRVWWDSTALSHRKSLKEIYKYFRIKPAPFAQAILFEGKRPKGSVHEEIYNLKNMTPDQAAGFILKNKPSFLSVKSAVSDLENKPVVVLALLEVMTRSEIITNMNWLKKIGAFDKPDLKHAYDQAMERTKSDKKVSTMKTHQAAKHVKDSKVAEKLHKTQEEDLRKLAGLEGNWLIGGDRSGSMRTSIEASKVISSFLAKNVKGEVHFLFFDTEPTYFNVTGKSYDEILDMTKRVGVGGATHIGVVMDYALQKNLLVNGIIIVSDGGENRTPWFHTSYKKYCAKMGIDPTVYLFHVPGDHNVMIENCKANDVIVTMHELGPKPDYYTLPNILMTLKTSRYALIDEIMETPLKTLDEVFKPRAA